MLHYSDIYSIRVRYTARNRATGEEMFCTRMLRGWAEAYPFMRSLWDSEDHVFLSATNLRPIS